MPQQITPDLASLLGKSINELCPQGFHDAEANHCAHFVSHAGGYQFGFLCHSISGSSRRGVSVRVQELFPNCPEVGKLEDLPDTDDDILVFITARRNVNLARKTIENVPRKHIGILRDGQIFHYSNGEDKVVRQTPDAVRTRFRGTYNDQTVDLFFGTLPAATRSLARTTRGPGARAGLSLRLVRTVHTGSSTIGELSVNGRAECFILEDPVRPVKIAGITAIPAGTYSVVITHSPKFGRQLPLLEDVPGFEGIRIHPGNSPADTEGCLLPGRTKAADFVGESRVAFNALFKKLEDAKAAGQGMQIEIVEGGVSPSARGLARSGKKPAARAVRGAAPALFRVLADPLRVRSTPGAETNENVVGSVAFGQSVAATGESAPPGWIGIAAPDGESKGFVQLAFLEALPAAGSAATRNPKKPARGRGKRSATRGPQPGTPPAELYRVKSASANLRKVAGVLDAANIIAALPRGHLVAKLGGSSQPMWWEVSAVVDGETVSGFIHAGLLAADSGAPGGDGEVQVSERALNMILEFEGMDQPSKWPKEQSGISLGHGYDLGYHSEGEFVADWGSFLTDDQIRRLSRAIGKKGIAARDIAGNYTDITIRKADADAVFMRSTLPKIKGWGGNSFPGITALPADAQGGLVSLVYNRGTDMAGDRRREMREVRDAVADSSLSLSEKLNRIAASIRSMKRLWPDTPGLRRRREAEATLIENAA